MAANPSSVSSVSRAEKQAITFVVSEVSLAETPLPETTYQSTLEEYLCGPLEACSLQDKQLVAAKIHPFVEAVHLAFAQHRPLVISPDHIWLLICQGFAQHINQQPEAFRSQFVRHEGRKKLSVRRDDFVKGSASNDWPGAISEFVAGMRASLVARPDLLSAQFSTTGPIEKTAFDVSLMDALQSYFAFEMSSLCGIPAVTLEGTLEDWQMILEKAQALRQFGLEWWINGLTPILEAFVQTAQGNIDRSFWRSIYKIDDRSGGPFITGWINHLFPYFVTQGSGPAGSGSNKLRVNGRIAMDLPGEYEGDSTTDDFPNGFSVVPFMWELRNVGISFEMELISGFVGIAQNPSTKALRPEIGWAVTEKGVHRANKKKVQIQQVKRYFGTGFREIPPEPKIVSLGPLYLACQPYDGSLEDDAFNKAWNSFDNRDHPVPNRVGSNVSYGLRFCDPWNGAESQWTYMLCIEVRNFSRLSGPLIGKILPASTYAVLNVSQSLVSFSDTFKFLYEHWLPNSHYEPAFDFDFERFEGRFHGDWPDEQIELYIPVRKKAA